MPDPTPKKKQSFPWMALVRYGVPLLIFLVGNVIFAVDHDRQRGAEIGAMFVGAAIAVFLLNTLFRIGVEGDKDRDKEEAARQFFDQHGYWPDEARDRGGQQR